MLSGVVMASRVLVRRTVAAADVSAREALAEMDPSTADLQAVFAALRGPRHVANGRLGHVLAPTGEIDVRHPHAIAPGACSVSLEHRTAFGPTSTASSRDIIHPNAVRLLGAARSVCSKIVR